LTPAFKRIPDDLTVDDFLQGTISPMHGSAVSTEEAMANDKSKLENRDRRSIAARSKRVLFDRPINLFDLRVRKLTARYGNGRDKLDREALQRATDTATSKPERSHTNWLPV
jgi:hypothetical protein